MAACPLKGLVRQLLKLINLLLITEDSFQH